jgi:hypothetical protein
MERRRGAEKPELVGIEFEASPGAQRREMSG